MAGDLKAKVTFLADTKGLIKGVKTIEGRFDKLGRGLERHSTKFLAAGAAMGAALGGLAAQGIAYGTTIDRMAESTGQAHEEMSRLAYSAELYHGDAQKVEKGTRRLAKAMSDASDGMATYQRAFDKTGISATDNAGNLRTVNDVLLDLADYMASGANETEKMAVAQDLLGGRQSELIPWLKQGSDAIREQFKEADRLGMTLDSETAKAMESLGTEVKEVRMVMRGLGVDVASVALPAITSLTRGVKDLVAKFQELPQAMQAAHIENVAFGAGTLVTIGLVTKLGVALGVAGLSAALSGVALIMGTVAIGYNTLQSKMQGYVEQLAVAKPEEIDDIARKHGIAAGLKAAIDLYPVLIGLRAQYIAQETGLGTGGGGGGGGGGGVGAGGGDGTPTPDPTPVDATAAAWRAYYDALSAGFSHLEIANLLLSDVDLGLADVRGATEGLIEPLAYLGEEVAMLSEPFADLELFMSQSIPGAAEVMMTAFAQIYGELGSLNKVTWDTMKKATAQGLKAILNMVEAAALAELMVTHFKEMGKITMTSLMNPLNLLKLAGLGAAYGAAKAAVSSINSFDESAVITRGGSLSGNVSIGDVIVSPDAMKNFMKGGGGSGGRSVQVSVTFNGSYAGDSSGFRDDLDYLADRIALEMER